MARIAIDKKNLEIRLEGIDNFLALRHKIKVPLGRVVAVDAHPDLTDIRVEAGTKVRGAIIPGRVFAAACRAPDDSQWLFCDFHDPRNAIAIDLAGDELARIVVEVSGETTEEAKHRIDMAVARDAASPG